MELEEAIKYLENQVKSTEEGLRQGRYYGEIFDLQKQIEAIKTVLKELQNSIPKKK